VQLEREGTCLPKVSRFGTNQHTGAAKLTLLSVKLHRDAAACHAVTSTKAAKCAVFWRNFHFLENFGRQIPEKYVRDIAYTKLPMSALDRESKHNGKLIVKPRIQK
jgi:hypothetical protein